VYAGCDSANLYQVTILERGIHKDNGVYRRVGGIPTCLSEPKVVEFIPSTACLQHGLGDEERPEGCVKEMEVYYPV